MNGYLATILRGAILVGLAPFAAIAAAEDSLQYNRDIRPILADACFQCHGPDSASREADLRLDQRDMSMDMGAIVPGEPDESEIIRRIFSTDVEERMPPPSSHKTLTDAQKEILRRWVADGAEYQSHWSFIPPVRPSLPAVSDTAWVQNPIDHFVLASLDKAGLRPNPPADRRTLARRVSLDLTGLPPAPDLVERFVNNTSPHAYEQLVDELLESPHWGEHRGRYWLDYARYADTHGIHFDNFREMWSYRDWVIQAFNRNLPYDQFTVENLAGDLMPNRSLDQLVASGFNRCNMTTNEGGIIDEEYLVLYDRDRTETTSRIWLGLTANCAVCHDHKFDPLTQREFYEMAAFFNNTTQGARDGNIKDTPPIIAVPLAQDRQRWTALEAEIPAAREQLEARKAEARAEFEKWLVTATRETFIPHVPVEGLHFHAPLDEGSQTIQVTIEGQPRDVPLSSTAQWQPGQTAAQALLLTQGGVCELPDAGDFEKDQAFSCGAWIKLPANDSYSAMAARMDNTDGYRGWDFWTEGRRVGSHIVHKWNGDAIKVVSQAQVPADEWTHATVTYDGSMKAAGVKVFINGREQETNVQADTLQNTIRTSVPFKIGQRSSSEPSSSIGLQDLRIYARALPPQEVATLARATRYAALVSKPADQRTSIENDELFDWWLVSLDETYQSLNGQLTALQREQSDIQARGTIAHVMQEKDEPAMAYVLFRGEYDKRRDPVTPSTPRFLPPFPENLPRNRLGFAEWLMSSEHPLTARVTVNRFWQEVFGTGLVRTSADFGIAGELPSNQELLDWLAVEFRESGWDVKAFFKLVVMSATYQQSAQMTPEKLERDPANGLLSRGPRFRMDAEMVRDYALTSSGLLVPKIGGPSVKPYQPPGVWEAIAMNVSNTRTYERDSGDNLYRRSLYTFWKRMAPPASMDIFNAPNREFCVVRRERTNTPLQALVTLNDEQFVEAARHLAQQTVLTGGTALEERTNFLGLHLLARPFRDEEQSILCQSLEDLLAYYRAHPDDAAKLIAIGDSKADPTIDPAELAAWTMLVNELMNLDEALNK